MLKFRRHHSPKKTVRRKFHFAQGVDFLALSFVRRREDMDQLRTLMSAYQRQAALVAKIERPEALSDIDGILDASDAIMIARGDLGVELPPEQVPAIQQQLLDRARQRNCPVIVATQMLESMVSNSRPTRAEVTDVSHSVAVGTDAVMLSAETAAGKYPVEAVEMMDRIARQAEAHLWRQEAFGSLTLSGMTCRRSHRHRRRQVNRVIVQRPQGARCSCNVGKWYVGRHDVIG